MRFIGLVLIAALGCILGCGGGPALQRAAEPVVFEFKDVGGAYVDYVADFGIDANFGGSVVSWLSTIDFKVKVDSITARTAERRFEFGDFTVTRIRGERPEPDPNAPEYKGTTLWLQMDAEGALKDWKGLDSVRGRTADGRSFKEYIVYELLSLFQPPPGQAVNAGSTWRNEFVTNIRTGAVDPEITTTIDYAVEGFGMRNGRECAKIKTTFAIDVAGEGSIGGKETSMKANGAGAGEIWFDHVTGVIVEYNNKITTTVTTRTERAGKEDITTSVTTLDSVVKIKLAG
jgi:hypothetical protein